MTNFRNQLQATNGLRKSRFFAGWKKKVQLRFMYLDIHD